MYTHVSNTSCYMCKNLCKFVRLHIKYRQLKNTPSFTHDLECLIAWDLCLVIYDGEHLSGKGAVTPAGRYTT